LRKPVIGMVLAAILTSVFIASAYATTTSIEASINRDFSVVFEFAVDQAIYADLNADPKLINETTVPKAIETDFANKGHTSLTAIQFSVATIDFNDATHVIRSTFHLSGQDIINSTIDRAAGIETFKMSTEWRKFHLNVTNGFSFNFEQSLAASLTTWTNSTVDGITTFGFSNSTANLSCAFKLPSYASNVFAVGESIIFDAPYEPPWEDRLINSPVLILIGLAIVGAIIFAYRKIR
jgi:hypothetical protein